MVYHNPALPLIILAVHPVCQDDAGKGAVLKLSKDTSPVELRLDHVAEGDVTSTLVVQNNIVARLTKKGGTQSGKNTKKSAPGAARKTLR